MDVASSLQAAPQACLIIADCQTDRQFDCFAAKPHRAARLVVRAEAAAEAAPKAAPKKEVGPKRGSTVCTSGSSDHLPLASQ